MANSHRPLNPRSERALDKLKFEVAQDLGLNDDIDERGWGNMTTREVGKIGGNMVKRLVEKGESVLSQESSLDE